MIKVEELKDILNGTDITIEVLPDGSIKDFQKISMMDLRKEPGKYVHEVSVHKQHLVLMKNGKKVALIIPLQGEINNGKE